MNSPRIAVVGLGAFGRLHAETLRGIGGASLAAVVDRDTGAAAATARELEVSLSFGSLAELIAARAADAIIVATRADTHVTLAREALAAGLAVFVEKPAAENIADLQQLMVERDRAGRPVMVDHICLFHSLIGPLLHRIKAGGFRAAHFVRHRPAELARRFRETHPVHLTMVHDLYVAARMVDGEEPSGWHFAESRGPDGIVDMTWAMLRWTDGRTATFHSHWVLPPTAPPDGWDAVEVFGDGFHSRAETNPAAWTWTWEKPEWPVGLEISTVQGRPVGMLAEAQRSFLATLGGAPVPDGCRLEDALQIERWTQRLLQSAL